MMWSSTTRVGNIPPLEMLNASLTNALHDPRSPAPSNTAATQYTATYKPRVRRNAASGSFTAAPLAELSICSRSFGC
jgi:hypothetical protein